MPFYYVQVLYQKNQIGTRLDKRKESGVTIQGRKKVEVGTPLLGNVKKNIIADKILNYF